ncbi:hypothetical protein D3C72_1856800 [compost metagenome]
MDDAPMAMAAFAGQVKLKTAIIDTGIFIAGKGHALVDQPLDGLAAMLNSKAHGVFMAQAAAGVEGVLDVRLHGVSVIKHGGDSALGPISGAVGKIALAQHGNTQVAGEVQRQAQTGGAAADHEDIVL